MTNEKKWAILKDLEAAIEAVRNSWCFVANPVDGYSVDNPGYAVEILYCNRDSHCFFDSWVTKYLHEKGYDCKILIDADYGDGTMYSAFHIVELK